LGLLRTFLAVVHHGSLGRTAVAAAMTQPAISQQMLRLEKIVGQRLFARNRDGVKLTPHGELLIAYANRAVDLNEEALLRLRGDCVNRSVSLGMTADVALMGFIPALKHFQSAHPEVEAKVIITSAARLDTLLQEGELDLAIGDPASISGTPVMECAVPLAWVANRDVVVDRSRILPLLLLEGRCAWRDEVFAALRKAGWDWRVVLESSSLDAIQAAVESGLGVSALLLKAVHNSEIRLLEHAALPSPPSLQFGVFRASAVPNRARAAMEAALAAAFQVRDRDSEAADEGLIVCGRLELNRSEILTAGPLGCGRV